MYNKHWYQTLFIVSVLFAVVALYGGSGLYSIHNDSIPSLMFSACFVIYFLEQDKLKALYLILPVLVFLPIFREVGIVLSLITTLILVWFSYKTIGFIRAMPVYIAMLTIPYLAQQLWFWHFSRTHDFFGRNIHSVGNLISIIRSLSIDSSSAFIYMKGILKILLKEGSIALYIPVLLSWRWVKKYRQDLLAQWRSVFSALLIGLYNGLKKSDSKKSIFVSQMI